MEPGMTLRRILTAIFACCVATQLCVAIAQDSEPANNPPSEEKSVRPGINEKFVDSKLDVTEWLGRFEVESREVFAHRTNVLKACGIEKGQHVADIGAGTGFFSRMFAEAVGEKGKVFAVDISPGFVEHLTRQGRKDKLVNLEVVLCSDRSVKLPAESVDVAFVCDTYHHFEYPNSTLASIHDALKPGGTLIVIDFERIPGKSREFLLNHVRAGKDVFRSEIESAGFELVKEVEIAGFEENYFLKFRKVAAKSS
jgi:FkbM family methyltransferase